MTALFVARRVRDQFGRDAGWGVYQQAVVGRVGRISLADSYTGSFARWRSHWQAASMNRAVSRRAR